VNGRLPVWDADRNATPQKIISRFRSLAALFTSQNRQMLRCRTAHKPTLVRDPTLQGIMPCFRSVADPVRFSEQADATLRPKHGIQHQRCRQGCNIAQNLEPTFLTWQTNCSRYKRIRPVQSNASLVFAFVACAPCSFLRTGRPPRCVCCERYLRHVGFRLGDQLCSGQ